MTVVAQPDAGSRQHLPTAMLTGLRLRSPEPVETRRRLARRRRRHYALRRLLAVAGMTGVGVVLLTLTFFSLIGR